MRSWNFCPLVVSAVIASLVLAGCSDAVDEVLPTATATGSDSGGAGQLDVWQPEPGTTWQWQLDELPVDVSLDVDVYDVDLFETSASVVDELHADGRRVICYISVGSREEWREDAAGFAEAVVGSAYEGWEGERWLDVRAIDALAPVLLARLDLCAAKGFDGVEPDNIDGYTNDTGFDLTYEDQLTFNLWLADAAHARGLSIGLKNDSDQVDDLLSAYDWALTEDCFAEGWCEEMGAFVEAGKAVFAAEYTDMGMTREVMCAEAASLRFDAILKERDLGRFREAC
jgi:endo-alpha-1,4-polygalactosaminidase (GH114 family)